MVWIYIINGYFIEFIHLLASEANEICERENKKTIAGEHVVSALQALGFEDYVEEVDEVYKEHKKQQKVKDDVDLIQVMDKLINGGWA